jgi:hypothetical protein
VRSIGFVIPKAIGGKMLDLVKTRKARLAAVLATGAISAGVAAAPASAQPFITGGLVNVTITNVLNGNTVTVTIPANVCAQILNNSPNLTCTANG